MPARVTSIDALGALRAKLIVFTTAATQTLDEAAGDIRRMRQWVRHDQRMHWQGELRRRQKKLDQAIQELMGARMSSLRTATAAQEVAVTRARRAMHEAEEKMRRVKHWDRNFDLVVDPLAKQLGALRTVLEHDMPRAIAFLSEAQRALEAYAETRIVTDASHAPAEAEAPPNSANETP